MSVARTRYVRAEKFREKQCRKFKPPRLEVDPPLSVKFTNLRTFSNVSLNTYKSKTLNLKLKADHNLYGQMNLVAES